MNPMSSPFGNNLNNSSCCICFDLRTGALASIVIGWFYCLFAIISFGFSTPIYLALTLPAILYLCLFTWSFIQIRNTLLIIASLKIVLGIFFSAVVIFIGLQITNSVLIVKAYNDCKSLSNCDLTQTGTTFGVILSVAFMILALYFLFKMYCFYIDARDFPWKYLPRPFVGDSNGGSPSVVLQPLPLYQDQTPRYQPRLSDEYKQALPYPSRVQNTPISPPQYGHSTSISYQEPLYSENSTQPHPETQNHLQETRTFTDETTRTEQSRL